MGGAQTLDWGDFAADSTFVALTPAGLVASGSSQAGALVSNSGKAISQVTYIINGRNGVPFCPWFVYTCILADINGTSSQSPTLWSTQYPAPDPGGLRPLMTPPNDGFPSQLLTIASFNGVLNVASEDASGFRFFIRNLSGVDLIVTPLIKQA